MNKCFSEFFLSRVAGCCWCCFSSHALFCAISLVRILLISHTTTANIGLFCTYIYIFNDFVIVGFQMYLSHSFCGVFHSFRWQWATLHVLVWLQCVDECKKNSLKSYTMCTIQRTHRRQLRERKRKRAWKKWEEKQWEVERERKPSPSDCIHYAKVSRYIKPNASFSIIL